MMKPTKYEYVPPTRINGKAPNANVKLEITQAGETWTATLAVSTTPRMTQGEAQTALREELTQLAAMLGGASGAVK